MRNIEDLIQTVEKYQTALVQKRFVSKKNTVAYVLFNNQPRILKWYVPGLKQNMETEYSFLKKSASHLKVPSVYEKDTENNVLILSYILGSNICDTIHDPEVSLEKKQRIFVQLAEWFVLFHLFFKTEEAFFIHGDPSIRNFIVSRNHLWGVDFEEARKGKPVEDVAGVCASLLTTDPMFTDEKFHLCSTFIGSYKNSVKWTLENLNNEISYALLQKIQWRPSEEALLRKYATQIKIHGLTIDRHNF